MYRNIVLLLVWFLEVDLIIGMDVGGISVIDVQIADVENKNNA